MYKDSVLTDKVMLRMISLGATALPNHDSFIVRNSYAAELEQVIIEEFESMFGREAKLKPKQTLLGGQSRDLFDIETYMNNRKWVTSVGGF